MLTPHRTLDPLKVYIQGDRVMGEGSSGPVAHLAIDGMDPVQQDVDETRTRMRAEFPGWSVWRARRLDGGLGSWCATRDRLLTCEEMFHGLAHTLVCDHLRQLREELVLQAKAEAGLSERESGGVTRPGACGPGTGSW
jgi:hypothetical protein